MSVTIGGVVCQELVDGLVEGIREGGPYATKKYLCAWSDRYALANAMLGLVSSSGTGGSITFTNPQQYPESHNMWAREIEIEGVGQPTQGAVQLQYPKARVTVAYAVPQFGYLQYPQNSFDPAHPYVYASQALRFTSETITLDASCVLLANGHRLYVPPAIQVANIDLRITLHRVPYLDAATIVAASQKPLNNATFLGVPAGYLRFQGADTNVQASSDGTYTQEVTYDFAARSLLRWDEAFDPDGVSGPQQVRYNGTAVLQRSDLSKLIPSAYGT